MGGLVCFVQGLERFVHRSYEGPLGGAAPAASAQDHFTFRIKHEIGGQRSNLELPGGLLLLVPDLRPIGSMLGQKVMQTGAIGVAADADKDQRLVRGSLRQSLQDRKSRDAGPAPAGPEIEHHYLSLEVGK